MATVCAGLGDTDEAFKWLEKAYSERDYQLPTIKDDIHFARLTNDPRFAALLEKIGLKAGSGRVSCANEREARTVFG
jgi:hypothetical protein